MMQKKINLSLETYEAKELADYLMSTDMHMSVGDRYMLGLRIYRLIDELDQKLETEVL